MTDEENTPSIEESARKAVVDHEEALDDLSRDDGSPLKDPDHEQLGPQPGEPTVEPQMIYLPQLIASEFAIQEHSARDMVLLGEVSVDGKAVQSNRGWFAYSDIADKDITVKSDVKSVRFHYAG